MSQSGSSAALPTPSATTGKARTIARVSIRKERAIRLGRKATRLLIGPRKKLFDIHEELLCANSPYFRQRIQKNRKPVDGECSICHTDDEEIDFCRMCGGNVHHDCMKNWVIQNQSNNDADTDLTCSLCRTEWDLSRIRSCACPDLDSEAFSMYIQWLYSSTIPIGDTGISTIELYSTLIDAWAIGRVIENKSFLDAILYAMLEVYQDRRQPPDWIVMDELYQETSVECDLRKLMVRVFVKRGNADWLANEERDTYPAEFLTDLASALFRDQGGKESLQVTLRTLHAAIEAGNGL